MKAPVWLLTTSVLLNGVLALAYVVDRPGLDQKPREVSASVSTPGNVTSPSVAGSLPAGEAAQQTSTGAAVDVGLALGTVLRSGDSAAFARLLRQAGVPEDMIRALVREHIQAGYRARIRAIEEGARGERPWWKTGGRFELTTEQRAEVRRLQREMRAEVERVLGPEDWQGNRTGNYAFLAPDKIDAARQIDADYAEMSRELRDKMEEFRLPSDRDALRLLDEERRADLAALLSSDELHELDLRTSPLSNRLRRELGSVVASEEEFRRIYDLAVAYEAQAGRDATTPGQYRGDRALAESALREQIVAVLGPERTALLARQRDPDYRAMQAATTRLNLPTTAIDSVMAARMQAATESQRITADATLDAAARRAALGEVAGRVRAQLQATMGNEGAEAFAQRAQWLRELERGHAFTVRPEGGVNIQREGRAGG